VEFKCRSVIKQEEYKKPDGRKTEAEGDPEDALMAQRATES